MGNKFKSRGEIMKKEKIYEIKLNKEEIDFLMAVVTDKMLITFDSTAPKCNQLCNQLLEHFGLVLRYQGEEND